MNISKSNIKYTEKKILPKRLSNLLQLSVPKSLSNFLQLSVLQQKIKSDK